MLVEVEAELVDLSSSSVENQGSKVDWPQVDEVHELDPDLVDWQLEHLGLDRHQEVTLVAGVRSSSEHLRPTRSCAHLRLEEKSYRLHGNLVRFKYRDPVAG